MAVNDIYFVRTIGSLYGQQCMNTYFFQQTAGAAVAAESLALEIDDSYLDDDGVVAELQTADFTWHRIDVINTGNNDDAVARDVSYVGQVGGVGVAPEIVVGFRKRNLGFGYRYSYKRFSGIPRNAMSGSGWSSVSVTDWFDRLDAAAVMLGTALSRAGDTFTPVQVATQTDMTTGKKFQFKLGIPAIFKQSLAGTWQYSNDATTQSSRKINAWTTP